MRTGICSLANNKNDAMMCNVCKWPASIRSPTDICCRLQLREGRGSSQSPFLCPLSLPPSQSAPPPFLSPVPLLMKQFSYCWLLVRQLTHNHPSQLTSGIRPSWRHGTWRNGTALLPLQQSAMVQSEWETRGKVGRQRRKIRARRVVQGTWLLGQPSFQPHPHLQPHCSHIAPARSAPWWDRG